MYVQVLTYVEGQDPKEVVLSKLKEAIGKIEVYGDRVLVATAPAREASKGGVLFTQKAKDENRFQAKSGLILKMGEDAFKYNGRYEAKGPHPEVGDWVFYRTSDSMECGILGSSCRIILSDLIMGKVSDPDLIW